MRAFIRDSSGVQNENVNTTAATAWMALAGALQVAIIRSRPNLHQQQQRPFMVISTIHTYSHGTLELGSTDKQPSMVGGDTYTLRATDQTDSRGSVTSRH